MTSECDADEYSDVTFLAWHDPSAKRIENEWGEQLACVVKFDGSWKLYRYEENKAGGKPRVRFIGKSDWINFSYVGEAGVAVGAPLPIKIRRRIAVQVFKCRAAVVKGKKQPNRSVRPTPVSDSDRKAG